MRGREISAGNRKSIGLLVSKELTWLDTRNSFGHLVKTQEQWRRSIGNSYSDSKWMNDSPSNAWKRVPETTDSTTIIMQQQVTVLTIREEVKLLLLLTFPIMLTAFILHSMSLIDQVMLGHFLDNRHPELKALAVAAASSSLYNAFFFCINGAATVVDTFCSTAKGANSLDMATVWFQRSALILSISCIPIVIVFFYSEPIFLLLGWSPYIASQASSFVWRLSFGLWPASMSVIITKYLVIQDVLYVQFFFGAITVAINIILNYVLITNMGLNGAPVATSVSRVLQFLMLVVYVLRKKKLRTMFRPRFRLLFKAGWVTYREFCWTALKGAVMIALEALAFDMTVVIVGQKGSEDAVGAHSCMIQWVAFTYLVFPFSFSIAASVEVGFLLGSGQTIRAERSAWASIFCGLVPMIFVVIFMLLVRDYLGYMFTFNESFIPLFASLAPYAAAFQIVDGIQGVCAGVLRGQARQGVVALMNFVGFWVIGGSTTTYVYFQYELYRESVWIGLIVGISCTALIGLGLVWKTDWKGRVKLAQAKIMKHRRRALITEEHKQMTARTMNFKKIFNSGFHVNQDCCIGFAWAKRVNRPLMVAYTALDDPSTPVHVHIPQSTDKLLAHHSATAVSRNILLLWAFMIDQSKLRGWSNILFNIFRGRSCPKQWSVFRRCLKALLSTEDYEGTYHEERATFKAHFDYGRKIQGVKGKDVSANADLLELCGALIPSEPLVAYKVRINFLDGFVLNYDVWFGYRGMNILPTADAGFFYGVSGAVDVQSGRLLLPHHEKLYAWYRNTRSIHPVKTNQINMLSQQFMDWCMGMDEDEWDAWNALSIKAVGKEEHQKDEAWDKVQDLLCVPSDLPALQHTGDFKNTREGIFTYFDYESGAMFGKPKPEEEVGSSLLRHRDPSERVRIK